MKKIIGYILLASPFVGCFIYAWIRGGIKSALIVYLSAFALIAVICIGMYLILGEE